MNDSTLSAAVPAGLIAICGKYSVTVTNGNAVSNSFAITVNPVLQSIYPNTLPAGSGATTVTATGLGFSSNVNLTLIASGTRTNLATTYFGSTTSLTALIPTGALDGTYPVSLFVADPTTGAVSQTLPLTLTYASVSAIYPNEIQAETPYFDTNPLNVVGANFVPGAQVLFDGTPLVTVYKGSNWLTATVPAPLIHDVSPGGVGIQVKNPGAAPSNSIKLVIDPNPFGTQILTLTPIGGCRRTCCDADRHRRALRAGLHRPMGTHPAGHQVRQCHPVDRHDTRLPGRH